MQKTAELEDLRIRRTRKLLQRALIDLTVEKGFAAITVRDITERAMVNRSTFYRHYLDKYQLLNEYLDEVAVMIAAEVFEEGKLKVHHQSTNADKPEVPAGLLALLKHIQQHPDFYRVMLGEKGDSAFIQRFRQNNELHYRRMLELSEAKLDAHAAPLDMRLSYVSCAGIGAILWWLENDQPCAAEQLAVWLGQLSSTSIGLHFNIGLETPRKP
ncbi:MAG: TetR/AcrR family transcriptional regulator [Anaerolineae bacterium]|nr:TetR/AcrR family transcriptional regulator [Anaerolineae bacterium]